MTHTDQPLATEQPQASLPSSVPATVPEATASRRPLLWLGVGMGLLVAVVGGGWLTLGASGSHPHSTAHAGGSENGREAGDLAALSVNSIRPIAKTLVRTLDQPGSVQAEAQAELCAKASGYVQAIQRETTPQLAAGLVGQHVLAADLAAWAVPLAYIPAFGGGAQVLAVQAPEKDIGSLVRAGELLCVLDVPELLQDVIQKESAWKQKEAELTAARTAIATFEAALKATEAQLKQAEAEIRKTSADHAYSLKQVGRFRELALNRTITQELVDEKERQSQAAQAALESSQAKLQAVQADLAVGASKLATAQADLRVKEVQVRVAQDELERARIMADYAHIYAPFHGIIVSRSVDQGDFVQNSSSGQARPLMTVMAIDRVKVVLQVPERDALWVQVGAEARLHVDARSNWEVTGRVARTANFLDPQSRTMRVEIDLPNPDHKLLPGMYGQVSLALQKIENAYAIPATAVYSRKGENYIFLVRDGVAHRQRIHIRYDDGQELDVVKVEGDREVPLDGSEEVIVSNKGEIREGQRIRATRLTTAH